MPGEGAWDCQQLTITLARPFGDFVEDGPSRVETGRNACYPFLDSRIEPEVI